MVTAATPSSPRSPIIERLKRKVVTAEEAWLTSSEQPLEQLIASTFRRSTGRLNFRCPFPDRKKAPPKAAEIR